MRVAGREGSSGLLSLFDAALGVFLIGLQQARVPGWPAEQAQGAWFCAGVLALWVASQMLMPERDVRVPWVAGFAGCALLGTLAHLPSPAPLLADYFSLYVLLAGGLYVCCGAILASLVASHATRSGFPILMTVLGLCGLAQGGPGWLLTPSQSAFLSSLSIPFAWAVCPWLVVPLAWKVWSLGSWTAAGASVLGALWRLGAARRWREVVGGVAVALGACWVFQGQILGRFACRPSGWAMTLAEWWQHPFLGQGFDATLNAPKIWNPGIGLTYRHNDLLQGMRDWGVLAGVLAVGFAVSAWRRGTVEQRWVLAVMGLTMLMQTQMSFPRMAGIVAAVAGYCAIPRDACSA